MLSTLFPLASVHIVIVWVDTVHKVRLSEVIQMSWHTHVKGSIGSIRSLGRRQCSAVISSGQSTWFHYLVKVHILLVKYYANKSQSCWLFLWWWATLFWPPSKFEASENRSKTSSTQPAQSSRWLKLYMSLLRTASSHLTPSVSHLTPSLSLDMATYNLHVTQCGFQGNSTSL